MATTSNAKIRAKIKTFSTNRDKLKALAHEIGCMILRHAAPSALNDDCAGTGDCTTAVTLLSEMPKSWAAQMKAWFETFTPIRINVSTGKTGFALEYKKLSPEDRLAWWKYEDAMSTPFYDVIEEPDVVLKGVDNYLKMLENLPSRIEKDITEGKVKDDQIELVRALAAKISQTNFKPVIAASNDEGSAAPSGTAQAA